MDADCEMNVFGSSRLKFSLNNFKNIPSISI